MSINLENNANMARQLRETFHDMRQPVASTLALAAAALTEPDLPAAARNRLEQIVEQAEWLADMIHGCLVVHEQDVVVRVPAVLVTPGELQGDHVPGDPEAALEALPGRALGDG